MVKLATVIPLERLETAHIKRLEYVREVRGERKELDLVRSCILIELARHV